MVMATDLLPGCGVAGRHRSWAWSSLRGRSVTGHDCRQHEGRACFYQAIVVGPGSVPTPCASRQIGTRAPPERTGGPESSRVIPTQEVRHQPCQPAPGQPPRTLTESSIPTGREVPPTPAFAARGSRSEEHTSELQSRGHLVCRLLLEQKKT